MTVVTVPYVVLVEMVALLTLSAPWRGPQPNDGWVMLAAYGVYFGQAIVRGRSDNRTDDVTWLGTGLAGAAAG